MTTDVCKYLLLVFFGCVAVGCTGVRTFHDQARGGDTVSVAAGYMHHFRRDEITVTITDGNGNPTTYPAGDPRVRAAINLYPDPLASLVVSPEVGVDLTGSNEIFNAGLLNTFITNGNKDWWETVVFVDLPSPMALGDATITVSNPTSGESISSVVNIVAETGGQPNPFSSQVGTGAFTLNAAHMRSLERLDHHTVTFTGSEIPHAIQLELSHDITSTAYAVNPRGDLKNVAWTDDGTSMKVILLPAGPSAPADLLDFKFYVTGAVTNLSVVQGSVLGFDIDGNPLIDPISATITGD